MLCSIFSWHEIGYYDLPAAFNLIKKVTKMERFSFIGVSEGNTYYLVLASTRPEYNNNVNIVLAVEPIAYMAHVSPLIKMFAALEPILTVGNVFTNTPHLSIRFVCTFSV